MANELAELKEKINKSLYDETKPWTPIFKYLQDLTGVDRQYILWGLAASTLLWLAFGFAGQLLSNFIGVIYPAYASIHAIESHDANDDTIWLMYWVVFAAFSLVEFFASLIVGWFPLYWLAKCILLVWLMIPTKFNGSLFIYRSIIKPYFLQYHGIVDDVINQAQNKTNEFLDSKTK